MSLSEPWILWWWTEISEERRSDSCVYYKVRVICYSLLPEDARHGYDLRILQYWFFIFWHYSTWRTSSLLHNCPPLFSVLWLTSPCPHVHLLEILQVLTLILLTWRIWWAPNNASKWQMGFNLVFKGLMLSFKWPHYVCSVGTADNIMAFTPRNDEKFTGTGFMLSQIRGHKNEDAGLLGCHVVLNCKQLYRPFLHKCNVNRKRRKTPN